MTDTPSEMNETAEETQLQEEEVQQQEPEAPQQEEEGQQQEPEAPQQEEEGQQQEPEAPQQEEEGQQQEPEAPQQEEEGQQQEPEAPQQEEEGQQQEPEAPQQEEEGQQQEPEAPQQEEEGQQQEPEAPQQEEEGQQQEPEGQQQEEELEQDIPSLVGVRKDGAEGPVQTTDDLKQQMWNTAWKNKLLGMENAGEKGEEKLPFTQCRPETIRKTWLPPSVSMTLESGSRIRNTKKGVGLKYDGDKPSFEDCMTAVRLGMEKGWKAAKLEGPEEYKAQMYLAMRALGMQPVGYTPSPELLKEGNEIAAKYESLRNKLNKLDANYPQIDAARREVQPPTRHPENDFYNYGEQEHAQLRERLKHLEEQNTAEANNNNKPEEQRPNQTQEQPARTQEQPAQTQEQGREDGAAPVSQNMQKILSEVAKASNVELSSDSKEAKTAASKMIKNFKNLSPELQGKFVQMVGNLVENHPDVAKQFVKDLNSDGKQGPARALKAYSNAMNRVKEAEAKGQQKSSVKQTEQQKQDTVNKIMQGIKSNAR